MGVDGLAIGVDQTCGGLDNGGSRIVQAGFGAAGGHQHGELVAAQPTGHQAGMGTGNALSQGADHQITNHMTDSVVDDLEMINIDQQQTERGLMRDGICQQFIEVPAIG